MIGELPTPGLLVSACDVATCRVTQLVDGHGLMRVELAYLAPRPLHPRAPGTDAFDGWWVAATFDDETTACYGDPTIDGEIEEEDEVEVGESPPEVGLRLIETEETADGRQTVTSRLFQVLGPARMTSLSTGWARIALAEGSVAVGSSEEFRRRSTTSDARPPGWLTHVVYQTAQDGADPVASYAMEWDWPSRLVRWVEVMPDGGLRARTSASSGVSEPGGPPHSKRIAAAVRPQRIALDAGSFEDL